MTLDKRLLACLLLLAAAAHAQTRRVLYVTHSAGFRHGSIEPSRRVLADIAARTGKLQIIPTEDLSLLTAASLRDFDALFFFTSGELALTSQQKTDLLDFVRSGKGFGGAHSATDTLYTWPEYGELIGAYFDGHPWVHEAGVEIEDPDHPLVRHLAPSFRILEEFYQFRAFSRDRVRVLMTLDPRTINLTAPGTNRTDEDFALAWTRNFGAGRVFYTALGHFDETWLDPRIQKMLEQALLWLAGDIEAPAAPRVSVPTLAAPPEVISPGALLDLAGEALTNGSSLAASFAPLPYKLAGTSVRLNGSPIPLLMASPTRLLAQVPGDLAVGGAVNLEVVSGAISRGKAYLTHVAPATPVVLAIAPGGNALTIYCGGLGAVSPPVASGAFAPFDRLSYTLLTPEITVGGRPAQVFFSGLTPGFAGLYQINVLYSGDRGPVVVRIAGRDSPPFDW